jgi:phage FluMu gp28-like protein
VPSYASIKSSFDASVEQQRAQLEKSFSWSDSPEFAGVGVSVPFVLLPYQQRWIEDESRIKVWEKSRRIGASWTEACLSVLEAAKHDGRNTIYVSYNFDMTEGFVRDCEFWASRFNMAAQVRKETILDEDKDILGYRIRFASGKTIRALTGKPKNIRGKQSRVVIDEAAFCDDLGELLKAAIALLIWGGQVSIISTHNGIGNEFNALLKDIESGARK